MKVFVWEPGPDADREAWPRIVLSESVEDARREQLERVAQSRQAITEWRAKEKRLRAEAAKRYTARTGKRGPHKPDSGFHDPDSDYSLYHAFEETPAARRRWQELGECPRAVYPL